MTDAQIMVEYAFNILYPQGYPEDEYEMTTEEVIEACGTANLEYMKNFLIELYGKEFIE